MAQLKFPAYIRTYGPSEYEHDIETYIKCLERHYKVKLRDRPACIKMVGNLQDGIKSCKRQLKEARKRKVMIIQKILHEITCEVPFGRTMRKYQQGPPQITVGSIVPSPSPMILSPSRSTRYTEYSPSSPGLPSDIVVKHPPNTAAASPIEQEQIVNKPEEAILKITTDVASDHCPLPPVMLTNIHMMVSPLQSYEKLKCVNPPKEDEELEVVEPVEWELLDRDTCLRVIIRKSNIFEGIFQFSLLNACSNTLFIYYRGLTDTSFFKSGRMWPRYMLKLVPGLSHPFLFTFTLNECVDDIYSFLFFKVAKRRPRYDGDPRGPFQALLIPLSAFQKGQTIKVNDSVNIPPAYTWHLTKNYGYPFGSIKIISTDVRPYIVEIVKCSIDFDELGASSASVGVQESSPTESPKVSPSKTNKKGQSKTKPIKPSPIDTQVVIPIVEELVNNSLEPFLFERTFVQVPPGSKRYIRVYFTKAFHVGNHQAVYELKFLKPANNEVKFTKKVIIFANALPVPIVIKPHSILDLTNTPLYHGYCEDYFTITNTHNLYGSMIRIRLTTKLEKLITIDPMEVEIPRKATIRFRVRFCTRDFIRSSESDKPIEYYTHFTIKISITGMDVVYSGCPTIYYEIIAPCLTDYGKVYKHELTQQNLE